MLVLSRRQGERIMIGDSITLTVVRCIGDKVRIGIEAPPEELILRGELYQRQETEKKRTEQRPVLTNGVTIEYPVTASTPVPIF